MYLSLHMQMVESGDASVIPDHLTIVINRRNEFRRLVEKSVEELLKEGNRLFLLRGAFHKSPSHVSMSSILYREL